MNFSDFLTRVLTRSSKSGGCGMSIRPEYYSGRGATTSDLNSEKLTTLFNAIVAVEGERAGKAFTEMVAAIPRLTATDFLITLRRLERNGWIFVPEMIDATSNGTYATDRMTAYLTLLSAMDRPMPDQTVSIRADFLRARGVKEPRKTSYFDQYGDEYLYERGE